jgi:hypothetical protein
MLEMRNAFSLPSNFEARQDFALVADALEQLGVT